MTENLVYLDSSSIVKRYLSENGTEIMDLLYRQAERGNLSISFSIWNIGEVIGVLDKRKNRKYINESEFNAILQKFYKENEKMIRLQSLYVEPIDSDSLEEAWKLVIRHHIYVADALQIATAKKVNSRLFLTADKLLLETAKNESLNVLNINEESERFTEFITTLKNNEI